MWPRQLGLERGKHVIKGPAKNHGVVNVNVLHNQDPSVANTYRANNLIDKRILTGKW